MTRLMICFAAFALTACSPGGGALETSDINQTSFFTSTSFVCDPTASVTDWLVVVEVETSTDVVYVDAEIDQSGLTFGPIVLDETRAGKWYGEAWEDDLGMDCESDMQNVSFYAEDELGNSETFNN